MSESIERSDLAEKVPDESNIVTRQVTIHPQERGARRMEIFRKNIQTKQQSKLLFIVFCTSIYLVAWSYALCEATTASFAPLATSTYSAHAEGLASLIIATSIITSVCQPFLAKLADRLSRPICYLVSVVFFSVGFIIVAASSTLSAYIVGAAFSAVGSAGINFCNSLIVADLSPLKWRGVMTAMIDTPYVYNCWFASLIVTDLEVANWRWGYSMFAIIVPIVSIPAILMMFWYERDPKDQAETHQSDKTVWKRIWESLVEVDAFALLLLAFGFSLVLLPLSLYYNASNQWKNPSLIAMFVVGGIFLIAFLVIEICFSPYPIMPKRDWNKTLICSLIISFMYGLGGEIGATYFSSYVFVVKDFSLTGWANFNNTETVTGCLFALIAGFIFRYTHRYKASLMAGLAIFIIGAGVMLTSHQNSATGLGNLIASSLLLGIGGGFATVAVSVSIQASVPHADVSIVIAILSLIGGLGESIGAAVASVIWSGKMPQALRKYISSTVTDTEILEYYSDIDAIVLNPMGSAVRDGAITAYRKVNFYLFATQLGVAFIPLIASGFQSNFYLGDSQNAIEKDVFEKESTIEDEDDVETDTKVI